MKVDRWISYADADGMPESPLGGMGGWFGAGVKDGRSHFNEPHTWDDYLDNWKEARPYAEAVRESVIDLRLWESGDFHQGDDCGVPVFDDGTVATFSFRAWGDLMAAIWTQQLGRQYCYMDFYYCHTPPRPEDLEARCSGGVKR